MANNLIEIVLLDRCSNTVQYLLPFVHGQGYKQIESKEINVGFHNHCLLLRMVKVVWSKSLDRVRGSGPQSY